MFRQWPGLLVDFVFPTVDSNEAPIREASTKHVDKYIAICDGTRLRTTLMGGTSPINCGSMPTKTLL